MNMYNPHYEPCRCPSISNFHRDRPEQKPFTSTLTWLHKKPSVLAITHLGFIQYIRTFYFLPGGEYVYAPSIARSDIELLPEAAPLVSCCMLGGVKTSRKSDD